VVRYFKKGLYLYLGISLIALVALLVWTSDRQTWKAIIRFNPSCLPLLILATALKWIFDGLSISVLVRGGSRVRIGMWRATGMRLQSSFLAVALPIFLSSTSYQGYLLYKENLSPGRSAGISTFRAILPLFIFLLIIPLPFTSYSGIKVNLLFSRIMKGIFLPITLGLFFFILALFFPHWIKGLSSWVIERLRRLKALKPERVSRVKKAAFREVDLLSAQLSHYLTKGKRTLLLAEGSILVSFFWEFAIGVIILWGWGVKPPLFQSFLVQFLLRPIIYFAPTPGASGVSELGYAGFFSLFVPKYLVGVSVLLWRIWSSYLGMILGGFEIVFSLREDFPAQ
jgi:uncharacterized protein (TIRG00374 family)